MNISINLAHTAIKLQYFRNACFKNKKVNLTSDMNKDVKKYLNRPPLHASKKKSFGFPIRFLQFSLLNRSCISSYFTGCPSEPNIPSSFPWLRIHTIAQLAFLWKSSSANVLRCILISCHHIQIAMKMVFLDLLLNQRI